MFSVDVKQKDNKNNNRTSYIILRIQKLYGSVGLEKKARYKPPQQNLRCLQSLLFSSVMLTEHCAEAQAALSSRRSFNGMVHIMLTEHCAEAQAALSSLRAFNGRVHITLYLRNMTFISGLMG